MDKSGRIRPEKSDSKRKMDDIEAMVRAEKEDCGDAMRVSEAALMKGMCLYSTNCIVTLISTYECILFNLN